MLDGEPLNSPRVKELAEKVRETEKWGPGGEYRRVATAVTAALTGNIADVGATQVVRAVAANYLQSMGAEELKKIAPLLGGEGTPAHVALHTLLGAAAGTVDGSSLQRASGAAAGVVVNALLGETEDLTPTQREQRKNIVTNIIAAVSAGLDAKQAEAVVASAQIETENNAVAQIAAGILTVADRSYTIYELSQDILDVIEGRMTWEELAEQKSIEYVEGILLGSVGKHAWKHIKKTEIGKKIEHSILEGGKTLGKKLDKIDVKLADFWKSSEKSFLKNKTKLEAKIKGSTELTSKKPDLAAKTEAPKTTQTTGSPEGKVKEGSKTSFDGSETKSYANKLDIPEGVVPVKVSSGHKWNWSNELNNPKPNTHYVVDDKYLYVTDSHGRVQKVEGPLELYSNDRNGYRQREAGKMGVKKDQGGHIIGRQFGGAGEALNLLPMEVSMHKKWTKMESEWANALKKGQKVEVKIEPKYEGSNKRPLSFMVEYKINDVPDVQEFKNTILKQG